MIRLQPFSPEQQEESLEQEQWLVKYPLFLSRRTGVFNLRVEQLDRCGLVAETDQYLLARNNAETWLAETLDGSMRTRFEYQFDGQELVTEDGQDLGEIFAKSLDAAEQLTQHHPNLSFELRRRRHEQAEYRDMLAMARGELPNTMVVVSDFPDELIGQPHDVSGYNVRRRQTMLRIISWNGQEISLYSQSLDGSNRAALEAIYGALGQPSAPGELLGQRIHINYGRLASQLVEELTKIYDNSLSHQFGGQWHAGRNDAAVLSTYQFVRSQPELVDRLIADGSQRSLYQVAALMSERFAAFKRMGGLPKDQLWQNGGQSELPLDLQLSLAARRASLEGKTFSGCGGSVGGGESSAEGELSQSGYGNQTSEETTYKFNKYMHCRSCQPLPDSENQPKKMCGPCGLCRFCDKKLGGKG